jgi:hypothetical protein
VQTAALVWPGIAQNGNIPTDRSLGFLTYWGGRRGRHWGVLKGVGLNFSMLPPEVNSLPMLVGVGSGRCRRETALTKTWAPENRGNMYVGFGNAGHGFGMSKGNNNFGNADLGSSNFGSGNVCLFNSGQVHTVIANSLDNDTGIANSGAVNLGSGPVGLLRPLAAKRGRSSAPTSRPLTARLKMP